MAVAPCPNVNGADHAAPPAAGTPPVIERCLAQGEKLVNRFLVGDQIGQGGFGQIFRGTDLKQRRTVAIKVEPRYNNDPVNDPRRLIIEKQVLIGLRGHRHIPLVYACGKNANENPYIVMQMLGDSLTTLRKNRPQNKFSQSTSFRVGQQITLALEALHKFNFIHRDIKPSNCCVGKDDQRKIVYLIDFGMCRRWRLASGQVRKAREKAGFRGTIRYASLRAMNQRECGPIDDVIGWLYSIIELYLSQLPWARVGNVNEVFKMKTEVTAEVLCAEMPPAFFPMLCYALEAPPEVMPDYPMLYQALLQCLPPGTHRKDPFDWETPT